MDDAALYQLLIDDPETGLRLCIDRYYPAVRTVCASILRRCPQDAEECINDSFLQLWRTVGSLQEPQQLRAYLCCIARNLALSRYRALAAAGRHTAEMPWDALPEDAAAEDADVLLAMEAHADAEALQKAVLSLKEPDREMFVRKYYYMESVRAIAAHFEVSERAVEGILYRSRKRLRRMLEEQ
jgi:RNA polymerase sigma-70 factor (ECF subfamily)